MGVKLGLPHLKKNNKQNVFESNVLALTFGRKSEEVTGE
jgi:hypothetical protein